MKWLHRTGRCLCKNNMHSHKDATFFKCRLTHFTAVHQANKFSQHEHCHWPNQNSLWWKVSSTSDYKNKLNITGSSCCGLTQTFKTTKAHCLIVVSLYTSYIQHIHHSSNLYVGQEDMANTSGLPSTHLGLFVVPRVFESRMGSRALVLQNYVPVSLQETDTISTFNIRHVQPILANELVLYE